MKFCQKQIFDPQTLRKVRKENKLTLDALSYKLRRIKLKASTRRLWAWEHEETYPTVMDLSKLAAFYGKPINYFFILKDIRRN